MNTKNIGDVCEAKVIACLLAKNKVILKPFGDNQRYDLVIEEDGKFLRIQCKSGLLKDGVIKFHLKSVTNSGKNKANYKGQIEFFAVYCPSTDKCYLIPIEETGTSTCSLRVDDYKCAKRNQSSTAKLAKDYEI